MLSDKLWFDPNLIGEAKLLVEVELVKAFPQRIAAGDSSGNISMVDVEYSWIPTKCGRCGQLGHKESRCLLLHPNTTVKQCTELATTKVVNVTTPSKIVHIAPLDAATDSGSVLSNIISSPITDVELSAPTATTTTTIGCSPSTALVNAHSFSRILAFTEAASIENATITNVDSNISPTATITTSSFCLLSDLVTISTPPLAGSSHEVVQGNIFGSNQFATLGDYSGYELGVASQKTRGGRPIKPTQKVQKMQWTTVGGRGNRGRGSRGGRRQSN